MKVVRRPIVAPTIVARLVDATRIDLTLLDARRVVVVEDYFSVSDLMVMNDVYVVRSLLQLKLDALHLLHPLHL